MDRAGLAPPTQGGQGGDRDRADPALEECPGTSGCSGTRGTPAQQWLLNLAFPPVGLGNIHPLA